MSDLVLRLAARYQAEEGQTMVEYGLIIVLISLAAVAILGTMGGTLNTVFTNANASLTP